MDDSNGEIRSMLEKLRCRQRVLLLGEQSAVETIHPAFDIYCSSSVSEGFPNALSEAMACGVVCVATDTGASRELVEGIGRIVPVGNAELLAEALIATMRERFETRQIAAEMGRQRILSRHGLASVAEQYANAYRAVLDSRDGSSLNPT
jgi:glycosyltransferase involved in cell wall biosynthesis